MTIQEMIARQQAIVTQARNEGRGLSREEQTEFDQLQGKIDAAAPQAARREPRAARSLPQTAAAAPGILPAQRARTAEATQPDRPSRRSASATATLWHCAARWAWTPQSISAAATPLTRCARRRWTS